MQFLIDLFLFLLIYKLFFYYLLCRFYNKYPQANVASQTQHHCSMEIE